MKINKYYFLLLYSLTLQFAFSQDSLLTITSDKIYVDNIGNIYTLRQHTITKYFTNKQIKTFSIKTFGNVASIDVTNALRVLLYFKDFQKILFLDSQLSQNGDVIQLSNLGLEQVSLVCSSFNNGFWVYNQSNNELLRFNQSFEVNVKTGNLKRILNMDIQPVFMTEHNGKLYLNSPEIGILMFDFYGSYLKNIPLLHLSEFQVQYPFIFYVYQNKFFSYHIETFENTEITNIPEECKNIIYNGEYCYWHFPQHILIRQCIK